jgi:hypothetical protein
MTHPEGDLANRRPVWEALSDLFLDTELTDDVREGLARRLAASPYTIEELRAILYDEVYPACKSNLLSVAGVWTGFDLDWLENEILTHRRAWRWPLFLSPLRRGVRAAAEDLFSRAERRRRAGK